MKRYCYMKTDGSKFEGKENNGLWEVNYRRLVESVLKNNEEKDLAIENIASGQMHIPHENLTFRNTHGYWGAEQQMFTQKVSYGKIYFENRKGML